MSIGSAEFAQFVAARWPALFRTAYLLTGDARQAEDLTQSALTNTYARRTRIRDGYRDDYRSNLDRRSPSWRTPGTTR